MDGLTNRIGELYMSGQQTYQAPPPKTHACPFPTCDEAPAKESFLDIERGVSWSEIHLCEHAGLKRRGQDVVGFDQCTGEPTLWFKDERQIGRKILNYQSCIPLLKDGFAKKYAEYEEMFLNESPLGDENFQAFLFVKWLNGTNENLEIFFEMCLLEDRENLYKTCLIEEGNKLKRYKIIEEEITAKRKYKTKRKEEKCLDSCTGSGLVDIFLNILSRCQEYSKTKTQFTIRGKPVFALNCKDATGNGILVFSPEVEKVYPRWETLLKTTLKRGFAEQYQSLMDKNFRELPDQIELEKYFQAFVLLQFEIERVRNNANAQLKCEDIFDGIRCALFLDDKKYYSHMTKMFTGDKREDYYGLLKTRMVFEENFLEKMKQ